MSASDGDPLLGAEVGRWRLERVLGEGGMGRVYLGIQPEIGARVAIKVLASQDEDLVGRFFAEARAVNLIRHENVVDIIDLARLPDGRPYIVMEFLDGCMLRGLIERGPVPFGWLGDATIQVLGALAAAHAIGIVHRDLKPDNIAISPGGRAKVLDFGVAKLASGQRDGRSPRTQTGQALGTPEYMAPEQITGGSIDGRTDLYAMGVVMFEAVTGRRPFDGPTDFEMMRAHVEVEPPSPRALRPDLPQALEDVILQALAKDPARRFANAAAMANAIASALAQLSPAERDARVVVPAVPAASFAGTELPATVRDRSSSATAGTVNARPSSPARLARLTRRHRLRALLGVVLAASALVVAAVAIYARGDDGHAVGPVSTAPAPPSPPTAAGPDAALAAAASPDAAAPPAARAARHSTSGALFLDPDFDPLHFDPIAYVATATEHARARYDDARLTEVRLGRVRPSGDIDLTSQDGFARYTFRSASRSQPPDDGTPAPCGILVLVAQSNNDLQVRVIPIAPRACTDLPITPPHCSPKQIWDKAIARGMKAGGRTATIRWAAHGSVVFNDDDGRGESLWLDDKCK